MSKLGTDGPGGVDNLRVTGTGELARRANSRPAVPTPLTTVQHRHRRSQVGPNSEPSIAPAKPTRYEIDDRRCTVQNGQHARCSQHEAFKAPDFAPFVSSHALCPLFSRTLSLCPLFPCTLYYAPSSFLARTVPFLTHYLPFTSHAVLSLPFFPRSLCP
eukprot:1750863-Pyramimonas_sp.AAC.1